MNDTLYRIEYPNGNPFRKTVDEYNDALFQWVNGEWVDVNIVPVEIDYEAAIDEVKKYPTPPFGQSLGWGASIRDIVNAALGIIEG